MEENMRKAHEEEAKMVEEVLRARQEAWQFEQATNHNTGECVTYFQETWEAKAALERINEEGRQGSASDNLRQLATRACAKEAAEE
eukprot:15965108-Heterocapsa_arctica.AAC.1